MNLLKRLIGRLAILAIVGSLLGAVAAIILYSRIAPELPPIDSLKDVRLQVPLRVYDRNQRLIAEFGEKRRIPLRMEQIPPQQVHAFLAAEDDRFYQHPGVDYQGLLRAAWQLALTGQKRQGGSTITMQVARNFFLSSEKTYLRKLSEILLALKIERELSKDDILTLYLNKIYLGHRAYGIGAAAQIYYGKEIGELTLPEMAMIAGLPKAPARDNPVSNPTRAKERRNYVLKRMRDLDYIDEARYRQAVDAPLTAERHALPIEVEAPYVAEMVRKQLVEQYGEEAYTRGLDVTTTLDGPLQNAANRALRHALLAYDRRHGYRGAERHLEHTTGMNPAQWDDELRQLPRHGGLVPGVVIALDGDHATAYLGDGKSVTLPWEGLSWARRHLSTNRLGPKPNQAADILQIGDVVRLEEIPPAKPEEEPHWELAQIPEVEGALVSLHPDDGAVLALVGGFDFHRSKFNRVTQAKRQPGSNFKPFIYSAALNNGYTAASLINDAPVVFDDPYLEKAWKPENYSGKIFGPTRLRVALTHSRNLVSIRLLDGMGIDNALKHVALFGFSPDELPHNLSLALGSGVLAPIQIVRGYAILANGGYRVSPYHIQRVIDSSTGETLFEAHPATVCHDCPETPPNTDPDTAATPDDTATADTATADAPPRAPRVVSAQNIYVTTSMLRDVIRHGTGRRALVLGRHDLAGKTGTTNDQRDAWFSGFNADLVTTCWVGFDSMEKLGNRETGGHAALPMWIEYMRAALDGVPERPLTTPQGLVTLRIDPATGKAVGSDFAGAIFETFPENNLPQRLETATTTAGGDRAEGGAAPPVPAQIF
ncbi:penicillin-binding protein 1A [Endothiovibrio diazotrophicus]